MPDDTESPTDTNERELVQVPLSDISTDPNQPRKYFDPNAIDDLANSIEKHGVLQPIILRKSKTGASVIVAGERRFQASKKIGLETIPAIYISENTAEIAIVENLLRENLTPVEESEAMFALKNEHKYTNLELGDIIGKAENTISDMLSLMKLPEVIRDECRENPKYSRSMLMAVTKKRQERSMIKAFNTFKEKGWSRDEFRRKQREDKGGSRSKGVSQGDKILKSINDFTSTMEKWGEPELSEEESKDIKAALQKLKKEVDKALKK